MSYSGLKSMIFAGVKEDDPRVQAVVKWIGKHYDLKSHPGQGNSAACFTTTTRLPRRSMRSVKNTSIDDSGQKHDWRKDLVDELAGKQRDDGSWVNTQPAVYGGRCQPVHELCPAGLELLWIEAK